MPTQFNKNKNKFNRSVKFSIIFVIKFMPISIKTLWNFGNKFLSKIN